MGKQNNVFERETEYGGQTIRESKKGWLVEGWSRYVGNLTNYKFLVPYENTKIKKGMGLNEIYIKKGDILGDPYNEYTAGQWLLMNFHISMDNDRKLIKILNRGYLVQ